VRRLDERRLLDDGDALDDQSNRHLEVDAGRALDRDDETIAGRGAKTGQRDRDRVRPWLQQRDGVEAVFARQRRARLVGRLVDDLDRHARDDRAGFVGHQAGHCPGGLGEHVAGAREPQRGGQQQGGNQSPRHR
jgi:hypothetical protein